MKKSQIISIAALATLMLTACGTPIFNSSNTGSESSNGTSLNSNESTNPDSKQDSQDPSKSDSKPNSSSVGNSSSNFDDDEEYTISVTPASGVKATLSKTKAKKGEEITLTLVVENGYKVREVTSSNTKINKVNDTTYKFTMPDRSVRISITVDVEGDVAIVGEIAASFTKDSATGKYVIKGFKVESTKAKVGFDVVIKDDKGNQSKIGAQYFDEARSFAHVESAYPATYTFLIASGSTYDFYYEPDCEFPFSVIRTRVDKAPTDAAGVYSLFEGRMRSSPACHPTDLVGINYSYQSTNLTYDYEYKLYENNVSFGKVTDKSIPETPENYYIYKKADFTNNLYTVVNTWTKAKGNNENHDYTWDLDPNKDDETNYYQPFSAKLNITEKDTDNSKREISKRDAIRNVTSSAHYGAELEYEFYDVYRSVYDGNVIINAPAYCGRDLKTTTNADGSFKVNIDSWTEYNYDATANTADATAHEGNIYTAELEFLANGALKSADVTKIYYARNEWNFTTHKPTGAGSKTHFTVTNTFGKVNSGAPDFDVTPYFINKIKTAAWFNSLTGKTPSTSETHVNYNEVLELVPYGNKGKKASNCNSFSFEPATALDAWQYGITSVEDGTKVAVNAQRKWQCIGVGSTNVQISNGIKNSGSATYNTKVNIYATGTVHSFFINCNIPGYDSYHCDNATTLEAYAGKRTTYYVDTGVNTGAPCEYNLVFRTKNQYGDPVYSDTNEYITVVQTGTVLILDCNTEKANALKDVYSVTVKVMSDYYLTNWGPSEWTIKVHPKNPSAKEIMGSSWKFASYVDSKNNPLNDYTTVDFLTEEYEAGSGIYKGVVSDYQFDGDTLTNTSKWFFKYQVTASGRINAQIYATQIDDPDFASEPYYNFGIDFGGVKDGLLLVALWFEDQTSFVPILGEVDMYEEEGNWYTYVESYYGFNENK